MKPTLLQRAIPVAVPVEKTIPNISLEQEIDANVGMIEASSDLDQQVAQIDQAHDVIAVLEDLALVASDIKEASPREAALLQIAGDAIAAGTGVDAEQLTPALEEGSEGVRNFAAKAKETIKKIWEAIKAAFKKVFETIRKFFSNSKIALQARLARTKKLAAEVKALSKFENAVITVKASHLITKDSSAAQVLNSLKEAAKEIAAFERISQAAEKDTAEGISIGLDVMKKFAHGDKDVTWAIPCSVPAYGKNLGPIKGNFYGLSVTGHEFNMAHLGLTYKYSIAKGSAKIPSEDDVQEFMSAVTDTVLYEMSFHEAPSGDVTINVGNRGDVEQCVQILTEIGSALDKHTTLLSQYIDQTEGALGAAEAYIGEEADPETAQMVAKSLSMTRRAVAMVSKTNASLTKASLGVQANGQAFVGALVMEIGKE